MDVSDNAYFQYERVAHESIASRLAPTVADLSEQEVTLRHR